MALKIYNLKRELNLAVGNAETERTPQEVLNDQVGNANLTQRTLQELLNDIVGETTLTRLSARDAMALIFHEDEYKSMAEMVATHGVPFGNFNALLDTAPESEDVIPENQTVDIAGKLLID